MVAKSGTVRHDVLAMFFRKDGSTRELTSGDVVKFSGMERVTAASHLAKLMSLGFIGGILVHGLRVYHITDEGKKSHIATKSKRVPVVVDSMSMMDRVLASAYSTTRTAAIDGMVQDAMRDKWLSSIPHELRGNDTQYLPEGEKAEMPELVAPDHIKGRIDEKFKEERDEWFKDARARGYTFEKISTALRVQNAASMFYHLKGKS